MIYTVTFNPSIDYIVAVDSFSCGLINRTIDERMLPGGKGMNVSMMLHNLGIESVALGFLAGFTGDNIRQMLEKKGVVTNFITVEGLSRINVKLRSMENEIVKEETEINGQGPIINDTAIKALFEKMDTLRAGDVLVLAGSIPSSIPSTIYMDIMGYLQERDIKIVVDATKDLLKNVLAYQPFLIKPNNYELEELFGVRLATKDEIIHCAKQLQVGLNRQFRTLLGACLCRV